MTQTKTQEPPETSSVKSYNATSFFVPPELKVVSVNISSLPSSFMVARSSIGIESCQSHVIALAMNDFPVTVSFIVLTRCYGHKESYNKAQLQIMKGIYENEIFMRETMLLAGSAISASHQDVSFFFTFERQGLSQVNIYLTLSVVGNEDAVTHVEENVNPEQAQKVMGLMLRDMVR